MSLLGKIVIKELRANMFDRNAKLRMRNRFVLYYTILERRYIGRIMEIKQKGGGPPRSSRNLSNVSSTKT